MLLRLQNTAITSVDPLKWECSSYSPEIHFNYLFMYTSVTERDHLQVSVHCVESVLNAAKWGI